MAHAYILRCSDGTYYAGSTVNLDLRLEQHRAGLGSEYTRRRLPITLVWSNEFERIDEAFGWEKRIQGWSHAKREAFMAGGIDSVRGWSARTRSAR